MAKAPKAPKAKTAGRAKLIVFWTIIVIAPFLLAEILLRVYFATTVGPDLLLYGFVPSRQDVLLPKEDLDHTVTAHLNKQAGYT
ncbi:MAG: hypothetical protein MJE12_24355, partial [Alphaproteobacteria bacterium]|nr:hypothetical protein [Alphaproteobacteria bacterium]